jgi:hypothetical protein
MYDAEQQASYDHCTLPTHKDVVGFLQCSSLLHSQGRTMTVNTERLIAFAENLAEALEALRDGTTIEEWEALFEIPLLEAVLDAAHDVEAEVIEDDV